MQSAGRRGRGRNERQEASDGESGRKRDRWPLGGPSALPPPFSTVRRHHSRPPCSSSPPTPCFLFPVAFPARLPILSSSRVAYFHSSRYVSNTLSSSSRTIKHVSFLLLVIYVLSHVAVPLQFQPTLCLSLSLAPVLLPRVVFHVIVTQDTSSSTSRSLFVALQRIFNHNLLSDFSWAGHASNEQDGTPYALGVFTEQYYIYMPDEF